MVEENKTAAQKGVEGKGNMQIFCSNENEKFPVTKRKHFSPGTVHLVHIRKHHQTIASCFKRSLCEDYCMSMVHYQGSDNALDICLLFKTSSLDNYLKPWVFLVSYTNILNPTQD